MPQISHVIQCSSCRTFQCDIIKTDNEFECKMCHKRQQVQKEWFRGTSRECRLYCMKMNNQRMESDLGFIDPSPQDLMNESLKSEFDLSFASHRSTTSSLNGSQQQNDSFSGANWSESSPHIRSPREQLQYQFHLQQQQQQQISNASSSCLAAASSPPMLATDTTIATTNESPPDSKRKYEMAVTPQKDRDHKRQRPVVDDSSSSEQSFLQIYHNDHHHHLDDSQQHCHQQFEVNAKSDSSFQLASSPFQAQNIRAEFRYQHLSSEHEDWHMDQEVPHSSSNSGSSNVVSNSSHPIWNGFMDTEAMPE